MLQITEDLVHDDENTESLEDLKDGTVAEDNLLAISELMEEILEQVHTVHSNKSVKLILKPLTICISEFYRHNYYDSL